MANTDALSAYVWDLRAHAESKLRCLTRVQQQLAILSDTHPSRDRAIASRAIVAELREILTISKTLQAVAEEALQTAIKLGD